MVLIIWSVDFLSLSQPFEDRHFTQREISFGTLNELQENLDRRVGTRDLLLNRWVRSLQTHARSQQCGRCPPK
jgi:hypothetical protein